MKKILGFIFGFLLLAPMFASAQSEDVWADDWGDDWSDNSSSSEVSPWNTSFFVDVGVGSFTRNNPVDDKESLMEVRSQLSVNRYFGHHFVSAKLEFIGDGVADNAFYTDVRELYMDAPATSNLSLRIGQQILTWGTGDYVFLNDFFPKDWQAMFSGREDDYLKASSNSIKLSYFNKLVNVNFVLTPNFTPDNYITGERFSYFNPMVGDIVADPVSVRADEPDNDFSGSQYFLRLYKTINGIELALYGYRGYYTQPLGFDVATGRNYFPRLDSYGASVRRPLLGGIGNAEFSYWDSKEDASGDNPFIPNSQLNLLVGFEREAARNLTLSGQIFIQRMMDHSNAVQSAPVPEYVADGTHELYTVRLTYLALQQKLTLSMFAFYSRDANDFYLKPKVSYRYSDNLYYVFGFNEFGGEDNYTQWGQFEKSSNVYARVRYTF